jgi:Sec7-like guanine-nucleotide exchange factor
LPNPDAFIHAVADKETIEQRFKKINQKGEVMSDTDVITRKDIVGSIQSYKAIEKMFISPDKIIHFDTSGMFLGDEPEEKNESYEKQLTDIISFISTKYAHGVFEEVY